MKRPPRSEPARCACEGGAHRAAEHGKPGAKGADHGDVFAHRGGCIHSELSLTTKPTPKRRTVNKLNLQ